MSAPDFLVAFLIADGRGLPVSSHPEEGAGSRPGAGRGGRQVFRRCPGRHGRAGRRGQHPDHLHLQQADLDRRGGAAAAGQRLGGGRFSVPRAERVRGAGRGVLLRPGSGHHRGAGADVAASARARACWWCRAFRARASRRCCRRGCCRGSAGRGWRAAPGSASWPCLVFTPARAPLDELALRVAVLAGADAAAVRRGLDADPAGFALTARQAALAPPPGPGSDPDDPAAGRHAAARAAVAAGGRPVRAAVHPVRR